MAEVWIPPRLQELTGGKQQVQVSGANVSQVINDLDTVNQKNIELRKDKVNQEGILEEAE